MGEVVDDGIDVVESYDIFSCAVFEGVRPRVLHAGIGTLVGGELGRMV